MAGPADKTDTSASRLACGQPTGPTRKPGIPGATAGQPPLPMARETSGITLGRQSQAIARQELPPLEVDRIAEACDNLQKGQGCYQALLYLNRARPQDVNTLFSASESSDVNYRWSVLWILSSILARLARNVDGREAVVQCVTKDMTILHFFAKFVELKNRSAERFFKRTRDPILPLLLGTLNQDPTDPQRVVVLAAIIARVEASEEALRAAISAHLGAERVEILLPLLEVKESEHSLPTEKLTRKLADRLHVLADQKAKEST